MSENEISELIDNFEYTFKNKIDPDRMNYILKVFGIYKTQTVIHWFGLKCDYPPTSGDPYNFIIKQIKKWNWTE
jgi:hypothetical protein